MVFCTLGVKVGIQKLRCSTKEAVLRNICELLSALRVRLLETLHLFRAGTPRRKWVPFIAKPVRFVSLNVNLRNFHPNLLYYQNWTYKAIQVLSWGCNQRACSLGPWLCSLSPHGGGEEPLGASPVVDSYGPVSSGKHSSPLLVLWLVPSCLWSHAWKVKVLVLQSCLTLSDPKDCSLPGSCVRGILQVRILEWVTIAFSRGSSQPRDQTRVSCIVGRFLTVWATREASPCSFRSHPVGHSHWQVSDPK